MPPTPPFDAHAARRLRLALGMGPEHVAYGMRVSYGLPYVTPDHVIAWERNLMAPGASELTALAGVLWCAPSELIGRPHTLREHRVARGLSAEDVARAVGFELLVYARMEEKDEWRGTERQSAILAEVLDLSLPDLITLTGLDGRLAGLLRGAVTTRWQAYVRPVNKVVPLNRRLLESTLQELHRYYQGQMAATLTWADGSAATGASHIGRDFLDRIVEHFWARLESTAP
ncbi:helix-turn-helix domain-containing protein [Streptomyces sp. WI04-05B]|uniref:helix-turn-helix domain-containing protein n=1 Tax=Streptomyces TaxID=1883 RepID=UPI0029A5E070|nr:MULTISPECIES: helix-turn-helix transcriptional regulator [unclassified Streptomyces]MDX2547026.1 helix-turn-helix transcriptional regulator [Streptomyces sp. WI04-05B]MDX2589715.1 helix-turn-helix transcriptional regulator [Streptomyces sp. WI04-05A]MDX3753165.1 helix-turn-helix transcriptional regulator [Streptomyces sp. AK08-02]